MIRDYLTEALQGSQFCCYHNIIIGIHKDYMIEDKKEKLET